MDYRGLEKEIIRKQGAYIRQLEEQLDYSVTIPVTLWFITKGIAIRRKEWMMRCRPLWRSVSCGRIIMI